MKRRRKESSSSAARRRRTRRDRNTVGSCADDRQSSSTRHGIRQRGRRSNNKANHDRDGDGGDSDNIINTDTEPRRTLTATTMRAVSGSTLPLHCSSCRTVGCSASSDTPNHSNLDVESVYSDFDLVNDVMQEFMLVRDETESDDDRFGQDCGSDSDSGVECRHGMDWFNVYGADSSEDDSDDTDTLRSHRRAHRAKARQRHLVSFTSFMCPPVQTTLLPRPSHRCHAQQQPQLDNRVCSRSNANTTYIVDTAAGNSHCRCGTHVGHAKQGRGHASGVHMRRVEKDAHSVAESAARKEGQGHALLPPARYRTPSTHHTLSSLHASCSSSSSSSSFGSASHPFHPLCVVLDIDETLVSARDGVIYVRPHVKELLDCCQALSCEVVVWTAGTPTHVNAILHTLARECGRLQWFDHIISRHRCWCNLTATSTSSSALSQQHAGVRRKDLNRLGRPPERVLVIENNPSSVSQQPGNAVLVEDYVKPNCEDASLREVCAVLRYVVACMAHSTITADGTTRASEAKAVTRATLASMASNDDNDRTSHSAKQIQSGEGKLHPFSTWTAAQDGQFAFTPNGRNNSPSRIAVKKRTTASLSAAARLISSPRSAIRFYEARSPRTTTAPTSPSDSTTCASSKKNDNALLMVCYSSQHTDPTLSEKMQAGAILMRRQDEAATTTDKSPPARSLSVAATAATASTTGRNAWCELMQRGKINTVPSVSAALAQAPSSLLIDVAFRRAEVDGEMVESADACRKEKRQRLGSDAETRRRDDHLTHASGPRVADGEVPRTHAVHEGMHSQVRFKALHYSAISGDAPRRYGGLRPLVMP